MKRILLFLFVLVIVGLYCESTIGEFIGIDADGKAFVINNSQELFIDRTNCVALESVVVDGAVQGTTETTIWTCSMAANSLVAGSLLRFTGIGIASNDASGDILTIRVKVGGVTKATLENSARTFTDDDLHISGYATQRTIGASGSRALHLDMSIGGDTSTVAGVASIDTTSDMSITITAQWDTADADNVLTFQQGWMTFKN